MSPTNDKRSWTSLQKLTKVLLIIGFVVMFILPCPGPVISKQIAELIRKLTLIQMGEGIYQVPLRWCSVEGSPSDLDPNNLGLPDTDSILLRRMQSANDNFWIPGAEIAFRSAFTSQIEDGATFPVISDHYPPPSGVGLPGDINLDAYGFYQGSISHIELAHEIADCEMAWDILELSYETNLEGIITININRFVGSSGAQSSAVGKATSSVNCDPALTATMAVCTNLSDMVENIGASVVMRDASYEQSFQNQDFQDVTFAHELGHSLFLGHGDGIDNDGNGQFDFCCDADEVVDALPYSLMSPNYTQASSGVITDLQGDRARTVASLTPGILIDPPAVYIDGSVVSDRRVDQLQDTDDATVDMVWAGMTENKDTGTAIISFKLYGFITGEINNHYVMFVDLDDNPETGGQPTDLSFSTELQGVEFVAVVSVSKAPDSDGIKIEPDLWVEKDGEFSEVQDFRIAAVVTTIYEAEAQVPLFDIISLELPSSLIGPIESIVRFQAISQNSMGNIVDHLPDIGNNESSVLYMTPPQYPGCAVSPSKVASGEIVTVEAWGLIPRQDAEVYTTQQILAVGDVDEDGTIRVDFPLPKYILEGQHMLTVRSEGTALTADCVIEVENRDKLDIFGALVTVIKVGALAAAGLYIFRAGLRKYLN